MTNLLPDEEATQLGFDFDAEMKRLEAALAPARIVL